MSAAHNRRQFLAAAAQAVTGMTVSGWASALQAAPGQPASGEGAFTLIDTHTHFYDPTRAQGVPWPPRNDKLLYRTVLPKDYRAQVVPKPVTGTVVVEASPWVEDNQCVLDLAGKEPFILGLVGNLPVGTKAFAGHLKRFAANNLFRGIRIRDRKLEGTLDDVAFVSDLKLLADYNLSLDLVGGIEILPFADRLAKEGPSLRIVIDHLAGVLVDGKPPPANWVQQMRALVRRPNVYCKLSGLVEGTGRIDGTAPRDVEFYRPVLDAMREMFGPERLIYASNWPVSERFAPLATVQGIIGDYFGSYGPLAKEKGFLAERQGGIPMGSAEETAAMKRRTFKQLRSKLESLDHHHVYVVLLDPAVGKIRKVRAENSKRDPKKPCVYVGMTGLTPDERFADHKAGIKDAPLVKRYGLRLLPELYAHLNPMPYEAAAQMEQDLAEDLRRAGYTVTGGH